MIIGAAVTGFVIVSMLLATLTSSPKPVPVEVERDHRENR